MATVKQIIDQIMRRLDELCPDSPEHWEREEVLVWVNDAITELNLISGEIQSTETVDIDSTENVYDLSADAIAPLSVRSSAGYLFKEQVTDLDSEANWEDPDQVSWHPKTWCPFGLNKIVIFKRPLSAQVLWVETLRSHTPAVDDDVELEIRPEYTPAIEDFCVQRAMFKEGGAELEQAEPLYANFLDAVQTLSGRNVLRRYPAWDVSPETKSAEVGPRPEPGAKK